MDTTTIIDEIEKALAADLPQVEVVDVEIVPGRGSPVIRVFIDQVDGVNHELCARVTSLLDGYLQDHAVEVSSPGLEKRLRKPGHFRAAVGEKIKVKTFVPVEGKRNFTGFLFSAGETTLTLVMDNGERVTIPFESVAMARTVFEFGASEKPSGKRRKKRD